MFGVPALIARLQNEPENHGIWELAGIVPPLFVATGYLVAFGWAPFFMVDDKASFFVAMRKSWRSSKQYIGNIFLFFVALAPIALLIVAPLVGLVAQAFVWLGLAYGYVRATGRNDLAWYPADFASRSIRTFLKVTLVALGLVAGSLVLWVKGLPTMRGTAWSIQDTAIRAAAILSSVAVIIVLLALLLPYLLDRLEGRTVHLVRRRAPRALAEERLSHRHQRAVDLRRRDHRRARSPASSASWAASART